MCYKTTKMKLIGPFRQIITLANLPLKGVIHENQVEILEDGGIIIDDETIVEIGNFERTWKNFIDPLSDADDVNKIEGGNIDLGPIIREELIMATMSI